MLTPGTYGPRVLKEYHLPVTDKYVTLPIARAACSMRLKQATRQKCLVYHENRGEYVTVAYISSQGVTIYFEVRIVYNSSRCGDTTVVYHSSSITGVFPVVLLAVVLQWYNSGSSVVAVVV